MWSKIKKLLTKKNKQKNIDRFSNKKKNDQMIKNKLSENINYLKANLVESNDLIFREFFIGGQQKFKAQIVFIDGMIDKDLLHNQVLKPLMLEIELTDQNTSIEEQITNTITELSIPLSQTKITNSLNDSIEAILAGNVILFIDEISKGFVLDIRKSEGRSVQAPTTEQTTRGPQEGFTETLATNITLIRKRLKDNNLMVEMDKIGERTNTDFALLYIKDIAEENIVAKIKKRLKDIEIDGVLDTGYIEQAVGDKWISPFPQFQSTERPDKAVANLLEGKIILMLDGTPFVSIMPATFIQFIQSPEDYYDNFIIGIFMRILRLIAVVTTVSFPAVYISLVAFNHELLPRDLAMTIAEARQGVPFPSYLEALLMEFSLELLREAGLRLPTPIGQTVGIVGGLILGEAAVNAGLVSSPMVIVIAITAISSFLIPNYAASISLRLIRLPMMIAAALFSFYGIMIIWLLTFIHLCSLESFDQPYFAPFGPIKWSDLKDSFLRLPFRFMNKRPLSTPTQQQNRQDNKGDKQNES